MSTRWLNGRTRTWTPHLASHPRAAPAPSASGRYRRGAERWCVNPTVRRARHDEPPGDELPKLPKPASHAGIELPLDGRQTPILWKVRLAELPAAQYERLIQALAARVEMLEIRVDADALRADDLSTLAHELDMFLRAIAARADRGNDLSELEQAGTAVAQWLARRPEWDAVVPTMKSVLDIVMGGGKRVHEALDEGWDPDLRAALTRYRDACTLIDHVNARWDTLVRHRHETTPRPLSGFPGPV